MNVDYSAEIKSADDVWAVLTFNKMPGPDGGPALTNPKFGKLDFSTNRVASSPDRLVVLVPQGQKTRVCVRSNDAGILTLSAEAVSESEDDAESDPPPSGCFGPCPPYGIEICNGTPDCSSGRLECT